MQFNLRLFTRRPERGQPCPRASSNLTRKRGQGCPRFGGRFVRAVLIACCLAVATIRFWAHDGPEHEIEELTEQIAKEGESADLLVQRAIEYRFWGNMLKP